ncbi:hypothetical protein [Dictyobacter aurantiacus]|uniref:Uncharacterized protein n=1 Tax=Dictyobacter aurantiacus TaxID=1936993 RepID=A0A401ZHJ5_9CHLR|nr:hypothetical protein [Dictyobacter aurantiacus]GCE06339.1 hypothetical protein KDAU_36680 [Dictyobacter aurantiacus]
MPTQDERIGTLEYNLNQFKTETFKAYQDLTMETVMLKGLMEDSVKRSMIMRNQIASLEQNMNSRFEAVNDRIKTLEQSVNNRFDTIDARFDRLEKLFLDRLPPA